jgi:hypothetical protein
MTRSGWRVRLHLAHETDTDQAAGGGTPRSTSESWRAELLVAASRETVRAATLFPRFGPRPATAWTEFDVSLCSAANRHVIRNDHEVFFGPTQASGS